MFPETPRRGAELAEESGIESLMAIPFDGRAYTYNSRLIWLRCSTIDPTLIASVPSLEQGAPAPPVQRGLRTRSQSPIRNPDHADLALQFRRRNGHSKHVWDPEKQVN
jgi:hypothetical protein